MQGPNGGAARMEPIRRTLVTDQIIDRLVPAIGTGCFPPGFRLVEDELASELGVSRIPVREAIRELSLQGILTAAPGRGWRVAPFDDRQIEEVCRVRIALETEMLAEALPRFRSDPSLLEGLDVELEAMRAAAKRSDSEALRDSDLNFHRIALSASGNGLGMRVWEGISRQVRIIFGLEIERYPDFQAALRQHEDLRRFLAKGRPERLGEHMREHITAWISKKGSPKAGGRKTTASRKRGRTGK